MYRSGIFSLLFLGTIVGSAAAQDEPPERPTVIAIVPYAGVNVPTRTLLVDDDTNGGYDVRIGYVIGARLQVPVAPRFEVHGDVGYAASPLRGFGSLYEDISSTAHFVGFSARLAYLLTPVQSPVSLAIHAGGGWMRHWISSPNPDYQNWPTAVAGIRVGMPLNPKLRVVLGAETFLYSATFGGADPVAAMQRDIRFTVGVLGR